MNELTENMLQVATAEVLEDIGFIFTEPAELEESFGNGALHFRLSIAAEKTGHLHLSAPMEFCSELAANMLGTEPDDPDIAVRGEAALAETLNIVAGVLAERLFGAGSSIELGLPESAKNDLPSDAVRASLLDEEERRIDIAVAWQ